MLTAAVRAFGIDLGDFSPMAWLGDAAAVATADGWKGAMVALWSASMWALAVAFRAIDTEMPTLLIDEFDSAGSRRAPSPRHRHRRPFRFRQGHGGGPGCARHFGQPWQCRRKSSAWL